MVIRGNSVRRQPQNLAPISRVWRLASCGVATWQRKGPREGAKTLPLARAERPLGQRDQATRWIWHLAEYSREVHEGYADSRWPETKRLLGLLVNSSGGAHSRNARRLVQATKKQDRRLSAPLLRLGL